MDTNLDYESIASRAHNNALDLLNEAKLLAENRRFARAFFLGCLSLEELGKSQITLDYINGDIAKKVFDDAFIGGKAHSLKLAYQYRWMELGKKADKLTSSIKYDMEWGKKLKHLKEDSVYTHKEGNADFFWEDLAKEIIRYVDEWLNDIFNAEQLNAPKRGSKALYK